MSIAVVILAGGIGSRMGSDRPKQFIEVDGKPIIIHTMDNFIKNPRVDSLSVVCEEHWIDHLAQLLERFDIKGVDIIPGGKTSHDSIRNGVFSLEDKLSDDDYVIIHDAARPVIPQFVIDDLIDVATEHGNACSTLPFYEPVMISDDGVSAVKEISRNNLKRTGAPQMFRYDILLDSYKRAEKDGLHDFVYANLVVAHYGHEIYFSKGTAMNIKVTYPEDIALFESILRISGDM